jgi:hypothetical protein
MTGVLPNDDGTTRLHRTLLIFNKDKDQTVRVCMAMERGGDFEQQIGDTVVPVWKFDTVHDFVIREFYGINYETLMQQYAWDLDLLVARHKERTQQLKTLPPRNPMNFKDFTVRFTDTLRAGLGNMYYVKQGAVVEEHTRAGSKFKPQIFTYFIEPADNMPRKNYMVSYVLKEDGQIDVVVARLLYLPDQLTRTIVSRTVDPKEADRHISFLKAMQKPLDALSEAIQQDPL